MRILYYSVHAILEDDEVRILQGLGHDVCCFGVNGLHGAVEPFRPPLNFTASEHDLWRRFHALGGHFKYGADFKSFVIPDAFIEGVHGSMGMVPWDAQIGLYQRAGVYLYASALDIPYTLNFIEAWMTGAPLVAYVPHDRRGPYFEIDDLVRDGIDGFVCRDVATARDRIRMLLAHPDTAAAIGAAGRQSAIAHFSVSVWTQRWAALLHRVALARAADHALTAKPANWA